MRAMQELEAADEVTETRIRSLRLAVITHPFGTERDNTFAALRARHRGLHLNPQAQPRARGSLSAVLAELIAAADHIPRGEIPRARQR